MKQREEFKSANEELKRHKETLKKKAAEEELAIQGYAKARDRMEETKKAKETQRFKDKLDIRQKMIEV